MVTAGTYLKEPFFNGDEWLTLLERQLLALAKIYAWHLEAWAVFSNHYHFIAHSPAAMSRGTLILNETDRFEH